MKYIPKMTTPAVRAAERMCRMAGFLFIINRNFGYLFLNLCDFFRAATLCLRQSSNRQPRRPTFGPKRVNKKKIINTQRKLKIYTDV